MWSFTFFLSLYLLMTLVVTCLYFNICIVFVVYLSSSYIFFFFFNFYLFLLFFFFFQAEDGIRDTSVTGVQTCALPISNKAFARFAYSALAASVAPDCKLSWQNRL